MSVAKRLFSDPRNTYIVDNNDPSAFDKTHQGKPGVHTEQRCCEDKAPYYDYYYATNEYRYGVAAPKVLWCKACETALESAWRENFVPTFELMTPIVRGIAMAAAYVPVIGTAVSFCINTALSLAEGYSFDEATISSIGQSLPGQPASGSAFNAVRSLVAGNRIDKIAIDAIPNISEGTKKVIGAAVDTVAAIASGQNVTSAALDQLYNRLPPQAQKAMSLARRVANGDNIGDIAAQEIGAATAAQLMKTAEQVKAQYGINRFIAETGYQSGLNTLSPDLKRAVTEAVIAGRIQYVKPELSFVTEEMPGAIAANNNYAAKGTQIINSGATWKNTASYAYPLVDIRGSRTWTTSRYPFDALAGRYGTEKRTVTDEVNSFWRRGFDIAIGACEGMSEPGPGQAKIRASLVNVHAQRGFDAGQQIQHERTKQNQLSKGLDAMAISLGRVLSAADRARFKDAATRGALAAAASPQIAAARSLNNNGNYRWGFDIATALCEGFSLPGPGQTAIRVKLGPFSEGSGPNGEKGTNEAMQGYDVGQALQHGITKARAANETAALANQPPNMAAGMLLANGIAGSNSSGDIKAGIIAQTQSDPQAFAGASTVIEEKSGFFQTILRFFGLA